VRWCFLFPVLFLVSIASASDIHLEGNLTQGGLVRGTVPPGSHVRFEGRKVRVSSDGFFLIAFGRDAGTSTSVEVTYPDGHTQRETLQVAQRTYEVQRIDGLPPRQVTPNREDLKRIRAEQAMLDKARTRDDPRTDFLTGFIWPVVGRVSGVYGSQRVLNGHPRQPHYGVDIAAPAGTEVVAPADGLVTLVHDNMYYTGGTLMVDHGHGLTTLYIHLSKLYVKKGQHVKRGQRIAAVGATGRATGPHLHWGANLFQRKIDPGLLVGPMTESPDTPQQQPPSTGPDRS